MHNVSCELVVSCTGGDICTLKGLYSLRRCCGRKKNSAVTLLHHSGVSVSVFEALLDEVELVAQRLVAIGHTDLGHVGLADVVALRTLLQVVVTQEVLLLLGNGSIWVRVNRMCNTSEPCEDKLSGFGNTS